MSASDTHTKLLIHELCRRRLLKRLKESEHVIVTALAFCPECWEALEEALRIPDVTSIDLITF